jgi:hypothetical protein
MAAGVLCAVFRNAETIALALGDIRVLSARIWPLAM